jgi:hypothetical protein
VDLIDTIIKRIPVLKFNDFDQVTLNDGEYHVSCFQIDLAIKITVQHYQSAYPLRFSLIYLDDLICQTLMAINYLLLIFYYFN